MISKTHGEINTLSTNFIIYLIFEGKGYKLTALKSVIPIRPLVESHYCNLVTKPFFRYARLHAVRSRCLHRVGGEGDHSHMEEDTGCDESVEESPGDETGGLLCGGGEEYLSW